MSIHFFIKASTHKPARCKALLYRFKVEVFQICRCQSEWYFRWPCLPGEAEKWGKDRRWVIRKWFIIWCLFKCWCTWFALLLSWFEIYVLLFSLQRSFNWCWLLGGSSFEPSNSYYLWWNSALWFGFPENWFPLWKSLLKVVHIGFLNFLGVYYLWIVCLQFVVLLCSKKSQRINEVFWKEWFPSPRTVVIPKAVEIVWQDNKHSEGFSTSDSFTGDKVAWARNVRIRTMAAAGIAREFGLKDSEIRVATMQSQTWPCWCFYVNDFKVPPGVYWSTRQWK